MNFKTQILEFTLLDLFAQLHKHLNVVYLDHHQWVKSQLTIDDNILPIRKYKELSERGSTIGKFMAVDNEPLAYLYKEWIKKISMKSSIKELLNTGQMPTSWKCDIATFPFKNFKFKGVKSEFRDHGLKLAHIHDAGKYLADSSHLNVRFIRSLSPLNIFFFPNKRFVDFQILENPTNWNPANADWAEDDKIKYSFLGWMLQNFEQFKEAHNRDFGSSINIPDDWNEFLSNTKVRFTPKFFSLKNQVIRTKIKPKNENIDCKLEACEKVPKNSNLTISDAVTHLKLWRSQFPRSPRLDGEISGSNPKPWIFFKVDGYSSNEKFVCQTGQVFSGDQYNGFVHFNGDTKSDAVDRFIDLFEAVEDYHDVLQLSATNIRNGKQKPKFALLGYEDKAEGFYLYCENKNKEDNKRAQRIKRTA